MRTKVLALLLATTTAHADQPAAPAVDTRQDLQDRGLVFQHGKRFLVVLPLAQHDKGIPASVTLKNSALYVGGATKLTRIVTAGWDFRGAQDFEQVGVDDPWQLLTANLSRTGTSYELRCAANDVLEDRRTLTLTRADEKTRATLLAKATLHEQPVRYTPAFLGRTRTTYLYVDTDGKAHRVFMGKRGAMKPLAIKEIVDDAEGLVIVTVKGTLTVKRNGNQAIAATFGSAKKPGTIEVQSTIRNRKLIFRELGVYKSTPPGHPCYEL